MFSCTYNGWADAAEDEREAVDAYEAAATRAASNCSQEPAVDRATISDGSVPVPAVLRHAA